jgi:hypothetical protein
MGMAVLWTCTRVEGRRKMSIELVWSTPTHMVVHIGRENECYEYARECYRRQIETWTVSEAL